MLQREVSYVKARCVLVGGAALYLFEDEDVHLEKIVPREAVEATGFCAARAAEAPR